MSKEAMKLALEALQYDADYDTSVTLQKAAIYALENAIADAEKQEPYADVVSHWHYWMAEADKYRFALQNLEEALAKQEQGEPVADSSAWWSLVMNAAASIEEASWSLRDEDSKRQAVGAAKHYREAAHALYTHPQPKQEQGEPVAKVKRNSSGQIYIEWRDGEFAIANLVEAKLYTTPQQRTWVGLTTGETAIIVKMLEKGNLFLAIAAVEAKLKEKNT